MSFDVSDITDTPAIVSFRCPPELRAAIERQARVEGLTASAVVRRATMYDLAARTGAGRAAL
jgi:hypothetical protein